MTKCAQVSTNVRMRQSRCLLDIAKPSEAWKLSVSFLERLMLDHETDPSPSDIHGALLGHCSQRPSHRSSHLRGVLIAKGHRFLFQKACRNSHAQCELLLQNFSFVHRPESGPCCFTKAAPKLTRQNPFHPALPHQFPHCLS